MFVDLAKGLQPPDPNKIKAGIKRIVGEIEDRLGSGTNKYDTFFIPMEYNSPSYTGAALQVVNQYLKRRGWELTVVDINANRVIYQVSPTYDSMQAALKEDLDAG